MSHEPFVAGDPRLRALGLIGDPFSPPAAADALNLRLPEHAAALELLAALDASAADERSLPVWVEKAAAIPAYYHLAALSEVLAALTQSDHLDMLSAYVPLDAMSIGRIRSGLNALADRISNPTFSRTLAAWVTHCLDEFDPSLPEAALLDEAMLDKLRADLREDAVAAAEAIFGPAVPEREEAQSADHVMMISGARQGRLEAEPAETDASAEEDATDPLAEAFVEPGGEEEPEAATPSAGDEVAEYVFAHTRAHLSPVVARGLRAYRAQGTSALSQELKVTKAPKKTLKALASFASHRYRRCVLIYDRFDNWNVMPNDNKPAIVGALTEIRWALGENGILTLLVADEQAPELAEQFAAARRVSWDFPTLAAMEQEPPAVDVEVVERWLDAASLNAGAHRAISPEQIERLLRAADSDLERFAALASAALVIAAEQGLDRVDAASIEAASQRV